MIKFNMHFTVFQKHITLFIAIFASQINNITN